MISIRNKSSQVLGTLGCKSEYSTFDLWTWVFPCLKDKLLSRWAFLFTLFSETQERAGQFRKISIYGNIRQHLCFKVVSGDWQHYLSLQTALWCVTSKNYIISFDLVSTKNTATNQKLTGENISSNISTPLHMNPPFTNPCAPKLQP